jgi:ribose transport system permease protein
MAARAPSTLGERAATWGPLAALVVMCVVFSMFADRFASIRNLQAILDSAAVLAVVTVGLTFVLLLGSIDLSIEGVMATCGLAFSLLVLNNRNGWQLGLAAVIPVVVIGVAFGLTSGTVSSRLKVPSFMTTVGVSAIGVGIASLLFGGLQPNIVDPSLARWTSDRWLGFTPLTYVAIVGVVVGSLIQRHTRLGRYATAIGSAEDIVALSGVNVRRYKTAAFALAGAFYALAAVMITIQLQAGVVDAPVGLNFAAITAAVVGGTLLSGGQGGVLQSAVGVLIVKVLENGLVLLDVSPYIQRAVQGVIVVTAVAAATWPMRQRLRVVK